MLQGLPGKGGISLFLRTLVAKLKNATQCKFIEHANQSLILLNRFISILSLETSLLLQLHSREWDGKQSNCISVLSRFTEELPNFQTFVFRKL